MPANRPAAAVFGPFDGDFDPFDDDDEIGVLMTFGRGRTRCAPPREAARQRAGCRRANSGWLGLPSETT